MTEAAASTDTSHAPRSTDAAQAGALLRAARQQQGLHIAALAAAIKVTPAKLEALEGGRTQELPDATFTRALALTVCRVLKTDPAPVLALLPGAPPGSLERVDSGLNTPFRERSSRDDAVWLPWRHPVLWLAGLLLVAAAAFVLVPGQPGGLPTLDGAATPVMPPSGAGGQPPAAEGALPAVPLPADAASAAVVGTAPVPEPAAPTPAANPATTLAANAAPAAAGAASQAAADAALVLRALQPTWVQATDSNGQTLMARLVPAGETVALTPALPVRLRIGNAQGTELLFRGQPVNLGAAARDNIANITLP
jgi:cytoskeleton protein RodZ